MRSMSLILVILVMITLSFQDTESPHGKDFEFSCKLCHSTKGWKLDKGIYAFNHNLTQFPLIGQHEVINCRMCHISLVFSEAETECAACHTDMHNQTVGMDCARCHTPHSWIVTNITEIHQLGRFPLLGAHYTAECRDCHPSASSLRFEPLGIACFDCHSEDYNAATDPDHVQGNFSINCVECHSLYAFTWTGEGINHNFFPLTEGHAIADCFQCHTPGGDYSNISPECFSCHQDEYNTTQNPNHALAGLSTNCNECHSTAPGWKPADFHTHDGLYFPIYSGKHNGEWNSCTECHLNPSNYTQFTCIDCHEHNKPDMDDEHDDVGGYLYESMACFDCHPTGDAEESFNHNLSNFPLTGAHITAECISCHANGYSGTPTQCFACHEIEFNQTTNPNHIEIGLTTNCDECHSTIPGWTPALFDIHNEYYVLIGAHSVISNDCFACHGGNYTSTPNSCVGCHLDDYNQTTDPPHQAAQFSTECELCHSQMAWEPSTFDHDNQYFPIYSGSHNGEWNTCNECHINPGNYAIFSCIDCHEHNQADMDDEHSDVSGYEYNSPACLECHPDGESKHLGHLRNFK